MKPRLLLSTVFSSFLFCLAGCATHETNLTEKSVRAFAIKYRDEWLKTKDGMQAEPLSRSVIEEVEKTATDWHVTFATLSKSDPRAPKDMHDWFLHVYINKKGELEKIV